MPADPLELLLGPTGARRPAGWGTHPAPARRMQGVTARRLPLFLGDPGLGSLPSPCWPYSSDAYHNSCQERETSMSATLSAAAAAGGQVRPPGQNPLAGGRLPGILHRPAALIEAGRFRCYATEAAATKPW